jgi:hypothetical protein
MVEHFNGCISEIVNQSQFGSAGTQKMAAGKAKITH